MIQFFSVLARVRLSFSNTKIRLEHLPFTSKSGAGIDIIIDKLVSFFISSTFFFFIIFLLNVLD